MSDTPTPSPALRLSRALIGVMIVLNLAGGAILVGCVLASFVFHGALVGFIGGHMPKVDVGLFVPAVRVWMLVALPGIAALHLLLRRALDILATVQVGSPFVMENAARLRTIAWCLLAMQVVDLALGGAAQVVAAAHARIDWDVSLVGWVCVALLFVLARVFEEGARMRDDLESMI